MNALTKQAASFSESMIPQCLENAAMDPTLFDTYGVKRGLRDKAGNGVVAGLTNISDVSAYWFDEQGNKHPQEGKLSYRGYNINDLVNGFVREKRFGFEETTYLLLFSKLPDEKELAEFTELLASLRRLPTNFVRDVIMKAPSHDMMNNISRAILKPRISNKASSLNIRGSTTRFIPPKMEGSRKIIPLRVRLSIMPIIFKRLNASRKTLRATPRAAASSSSLGIGSPVRKSFSLR